MSVTIDPNDLQALILRMNSMSNDLRDLRDDNLNLRRQINECTESNENLQRRLNEVARIAYSEYTKIDTISSESLKKKEIVLIVAESVGVAGGIGAVAGGVVMCALPGGAVIGVPMIAGGVGAIGLSSAFLGKDAQKFAETHSVIHHAEEREIVLSFNQARNFIESDPEEIDPPQRHVDIMLENTDILTVKQQDIFLMD